MSLLRPPSHRGPLIAAGAVVLTLGVVLQQARIDDLGAGWQMLICGMPAALFLWLAVGAPLEGGRPPAYQSVLIVCGLVNLVPGLLNLADALGAGGEDADIGPGTGTWVSLVVAAVAGALGVRRNSAVATLIAAGAVIAAVFFGAEWVSDPERSSYRILSLLLAAGLVLLSLVLRGSRPRHSELMVDVAGLAILWIPLAELFGALFGFSFFGPPPTLLPGFWEVVVLGTGFGLVAYAAADRAPGPAYVGVANLAAFAAVVTVGADRTLEWWPFLLLVVGGFMLAAGLRPARPLPPEPSGYRRDDLPLAARVDGEETIYTVRD